jgi:excisionase family DNA binding protein
MTSKELNILALKMANILADNVASKIIERLGWNNSGLLTRKEAAAFIGYSESYLRKQKEIPTYRLGRKTLYKREDLAAFLNKHNVAKE